MCTVSHTFLLLIVGIQLYVKDIYARPQTPNIGNRCPSTGIPQGSKRGINVLHGSKPVFKIDVGELGKHGYLPGTPYEVRVKAQDPNNKFGNVLLWLQRESDKCDIGVLDSTQGLYHQPENCAHMVYKDTRPAAYKFTFGWTAPECGCILIRARVESADKSVLFMEDETVIDGYLTKRVCPKQDPLILNQMSREQKQQLLCGVTKTATARDVALRSYVQTRRKVDYDKMPIIEKEAWLMVFDQKIYEVQQCCHMIKSKQDVCLADLRRHRIDRFCAYGESIVPFTVKRRAFMMKREEECCWRLGEGRYQCFASGPMMDGTGSHIDAMENMDESDPVNDLEDFRTELGYKTIKPMSNLQVNVQNEDDRVMQKYAKNAQEVDNNNDEIQTHDAQISGSMRIDKATDESVNDPIREKKPFVLSTPSVHFMKETSEVLKRKLQRAQTKLECCDSGKQYGSGLISGDAWDRCESQAHIIAKSYKTGKRRCKNFFMRCCFEHSTRSNIESQEEEDDDIQETENDDSDENKQQLYENKKSSDEKEDEIDDETVQGVDDENDDLKIRSEKKRKNRHNKKLRRRNRKKKAAKLTKRM